jgi:hypothetical protein
MTASLSPAGAISSPKAHSTGLAAFPTACREARLIENPGAARWVPLSSLPGNLAATLSSVAPTWPPFFSIWAAALPRTRPSTSPSRSAL